MSANEINQAGWKHEQDVGTVCRLGREECETSTVDFVCVLLLCALPKQCESTQRARHLCSPGASMSVTSL